MVLEQNRKVIRQRPQARALAQRMRGLRGPAEGTPRDGAPERESPFSVKLVLYLKKHLDAGETHYTARPGMVALRRRLADALAGLGAPARDPDGILITAGEGEAVFACLLAFGYGPGDQARFSGRWQRHARLLDMMGVTVLDEPPEAPLEEWRLLPPPRAAQGASPPSDAAESAVASGVPSSDAAAPSGGVPEEGMSASAAPATDTPSSSATSPRRPVPIVCLGDVFGAGSGELPELNRDAIYVGNLDGLPEMDMFGLGFVAGSPEWIKRIMTWKQAFSICSPAPSQRAALLAFERWDERQAEAGP